MKNSLLQIVQKLLSKNKIAFDKKELDFQIQSHPSYPSLHAITGVLDHFNIENIAAEVPVSLETLQQLPTTFIAQIKTDKGDDLATISRNKSQYSIISELKNDTTTETEFLKIFTGIIVAVEKDENEVKKQENSLPSILLLSSLALLIGFTLINKNIGIANILFIALSILGIIASYSILKQELGESTIIGNAFCSGNNEKKDCDAVLSSKGAEIIKNHKLSDLSILYFSGLLLTSFLTTNFNTLYIISFLGLPITLYSIYYQNSVVKSWCTLCLSIVGILWLQAAVAFTQVSSFTTFLNLSVNSIIITTISFLITYIVWHFVKPLFKKVIELESDKIEAVKFKRNFNLFDTLLNKSPRIETRINSDTEIIFGNKNANLEIIIITNPFCGHCKPVHKTINKILDRYPDLVKIVVRFNVPIENPEANGTIVSSRLIELYNEKDINECKNAMDDIYGGMKLDKWISKWNKTTNFNLYSKTLQIEKEWCTNNSINFTPEILINGKSFPKEYKREDLLFFIEDLEESNILVN